ncbi:uncharacterized protein LOC121901797 isoform X2 [Thunnus maccoyii]|uniref:uncharacterized protein LOC121901797 isoform X2 n=1 Tax=Thunnus maccoyii TaxID=8240 RepID=UPI001C4A99DB|nr:uncharacterized protein LOC121901797 isoform X2 [Thunnus maccoyii]
MKGKPFHGTTPAVPSIGLSSGTDRDEHLDVIAEATEMQVLEQSLHGMSIVEEDMEENVFNDPLNSVIDWADEGSPSFHRKDDGKNADSSDEEYLPPISICRIGGALQKAPSIDRLEAIGIDETVHDQPSHEDPLDEPSPCDQVPVFPAPQCVLCEDDIIGARASIVYEDCLSQLATLVILPADKCSSLLKTGVLCNCVAPFDIKITSKGTSINIVWFLPGNARIPFPLELPCLAQIAGRSETDYVSCWTGNSETKPYSPYSKFRNYYEQPVHITVI